MSVPPQAPPTRNRRKNIQPKLGAKEHRNPAHRAASDDITKHWTDMKTKVIFLKRTSATANFAQPMRTFPFPIYSLTLTWGRARLSVKAGNNAHKLPFTRLFPAVKVAECSSQPSCYHHSHK